jgi:hypothetical protein
MNLTRNLIGAKFSEASLEVPHPTQRRIILLTCSRSVQICYFYYQLPTLCVTAPWYRLFFFFVETYFAGNIIIFAVGSATDMECVVVLRLLLCLPLTSAVSVSMRVISEGRNAEVHCCGPGESPEVLAERAAAVLKLPVLRERYLRQMLTTRSSNRSRHIHTVSAGTSAATRPPVSIGLEISSSRCGEARRLATLRKLLVLFSECAAQGVVAYVLVMVERTCLAYSEFTRLLAEFSLLSFYLKNANESGRAHSISLLLNHIKADYMLYWDSSWAITEHLSNPGTIAGILRDALLVLVPHSNLHSSLHIGQVTLECRVHSSNRGAGRIVNASSLQHSHLLHEYGICDQDNLDGWWPGFSFKPGTIFVNLNMFPTAHSCILLRYMELSGHSQSATQH